MLQIQPNATAGIWGMFDNLLHIAQQGGAVVSILVGLSVIALTVILVKLWQFWALKPAPSRVVEVLVASLGQQPVTAPRRDPVSRLLAHLSVLLAEKRLPVADLRMESVRKARQLLAELSDHLRILEVIATVAPLLGLFGTVLGMIEAFQAMEAAGSQVNPAVLSGGIWQALLTTAVGLAVAIPVSMAHSWFERKVEVQAAAMQDVMDRVFLLQAEQGVAATKAVASAQAA